jgi:8-oxo-dGTP pyrophosphatase MutT (NUDIX family)
VFVFPGGSRDPADSAASGFAETLRPPAAGRVDRATRRRLAAYARTALRETLEETGTLLAAPEAMSGAEPGPAGPAEGIWRRYADRGLAPHFAGMTLLARAITPVDSPIRFHTRFFLALGSRVERVQEVDGELEQIGWYPAAEALNEMPLAGISRQILAEALLARRDPAAYPPPLFRSIKDSLMIRCTG